MKKAIILMSLVLGVLGLAPSSLLALGAIAVAERSGGGQPITGIAANYRTGVEATDAAIAQCVSNGGRNCRIVLEFERCGSIAVSDKSIGAGKGNTGRIARNASLRSCGGEECRVIGNECEEQ